MVARREGQVNGRRRGGAARTAVGTSDREEKRPGNKILHTWKSGMRDLRNIKDWGVSESGHI